MFFGIYCLMVGGSSLTDEMRTCLFRGARAMHQQKSEQTRIITDDLEAIIQTDFRCTGFGWIYGTLFSAQVDSIHGKTTVRYIVRTEDLGEIDPEDMHWVGLTDLYRSDSGNARWN